MTGVPGTRKPRRRRNTRLLHPLLFRFLPFTSDLHMHGLLHQAWLSRADVVSIYKAGKDSAACNHRSLSNMPVWDPKP